MLQGLKYCGSSPLASRTIAWSAMFARSRFAPCLVGTNERILTGPRVLPICWYTRSREGMSYLTRRTTGVSALEERSRRRVRDHPVPRRRKRTGGGTGWCAPERDDGEGKGRESLLGAK